MKVDTRDLARGERHPFWKGDAVGYHALHHWVRKYKNKPDSCNHCGSSEKRLEWANISKQYRRDLDDWIALCKKCHMAYDRRPECPNGHPRTDENTIVNRHGTPRCRICCVEHLRRWRQRQKELKAAGA